MVQILRNIKIILFAVMATNLLINKIVNLTKITLVKMLLQNFRREIVPLFMTKEVFKDFNKSINL